MGTKEKQNGTGPSKWWQWLLMYPTILVSIVGAVPQYTTWVKAYKLGIPADAVGSALEQNKLWKKNCECVQAIQPITAKTETNDTLEATLCPSGDVLIKIVRPGKKAEAEYRWVGLHTFTVQDRQAGLLLGEAFAETCPGEGVVVAQARNVSPGPRVLCQKRLPNGFILRVTQYPPHGNCIEEIIDPYRGAVVSSKAVACYGC